jgi:DNA replication licensing factor MCM7
MGDLNLQDDNLSDEYDFMDDEDSEGRTTRQRAQNRAKEPKLKYLELLQSIADRYEDEITIDLDDLAKVGTCMQLLARAPNC